MRPTTRFAFITAAVALSTVLSTRAKAYALLGYIWQQGSMTYYLNPTNMDLPTSAIEPAIRAGADAWRLQSGASFSFLFAGFSAQSTIANDVTNLVMFRNVSSDSAIAKGDCYLSGVRPLVALVALRARAAALLRNRSIWPLGRVTQISPIHSSFTPVIGLALKLVRLTEVGDFPRSIVFR